MTRDEAITVSNLERDTLDRLVAAKIAIESATVSAAFLSAKAARELGESIPF